MSYDRKLDWTCPHIVREEALFLSADRVSVRPLRPIASADSVRVRVNGEVDVGPTGEALPAEVTASRQGPFTIDSTSNTLIVLTNNSNVPQVVVLPSGKGLSVQQVAEALATRIAGVSVSVVKQRLVLQTQQFGKAATLMLLPGSTLAPLLGLSVNRQWRGRVTVPGWSLVRDPNTLDDRPTRFLVFDEPLKGYRDFVEIDYATVRQECRRCGGLGIENDWRYNQNGETVQVRDEALLIQEFQKIVYTIQGSNTFHIWYGTNILESIGKKLTSSGVVQQFITSDIREAFRRWQSVKRQQEQAAGQFVSDEEYPFNLLQVVLTQSQKDPTVIFVNATVQNRSAKPIQIDRGVRVPLPDNLLGSTTQEGVARQSLSNFVLTG